MARHGTYSKKRTLLDRTRWSAKRKWRWFAQLSKPKKALVIAAPILAFLIITPIFTYLYYYNDIANQARLMNANNTGIVLLDKNGKKFYSSGRAEHHELVPLSQISDATEHALLASEDKDFYNHSGFSFLSIVRSLYTNILAGDATGYGGSTLTQQLAKNTLLTENKNFLRKYQELTIAMAIEQRYSKDEILDMYLNSVFFGGSVFGIDDAAEFYFGIHAKDLNLAQSAMLIGILPAPNAYSPTLGNPKYAKERQEVVLERMVKNGYITEEEKTAALNEKLHYVKQKSDINNEAPHFTQMVLKELYDKYGEEKVNRSGYQVKTTLDLNLQKTAVRSVADNMPHIDANGGSNASLVAVDPKTGQIRALVGSRNYENKKFGQVNMALTPRQPGSTFKPIYYSLGLANGTITPITVLHDAPTDFNGYKPHNATRQNYGDVTVRQALDWSLNIPSVKVMQKVGISATIDQAKLMGITTLKNASDYGLSLAIGSAEVPLVEMTNAYASFANQGDQYPTSTIYSIEDKFSKTIFVNKSTSKRVISPQGAYLISDILSDNATRAFMFGTALNVYGSDGSVKKVAVKTGTTDDNRDAWTIGYTPNMTIGVWVGNNDNKVMVSGGSDMAGPIWNQVMVAAIGSSDPAFVRPDGIVEQTVCNATGIHTDVFLANHVPASTCSTTPAAPAKDKPEKKKPDTKPKQDKNNQEQTGTGDDTTTPPGTTDDGSSGGGTDDGTGGTGTGTGTGTGGAGTPLPTGG